MQKPNLAIWIISCSCNCGNKWTHSYVTFLAGGTPSPAEEHSGKVTTIHDHSHKQVSHCFLCATLGLGLGWQKPNPIPTTSTSTPKPKPMVQDLLED